MQDAYRMPQDRLTERLKARLTEASVSSARVPKNRRKIQCLQCALTEAIIKSVGLHTICLKLNLKSDFNFEN